MSSLRLPLGSEEESYPPGPLRVGTPSLALLLEPVVVVPMHYYIPGLTTETSTLKTAEGWLGTQGNVRRLDDSQVRIGRGDLPDRQEVWVLQPLRAQGP